MRNVRLLISYDGSHFHGWQRQDGFVSVQQVLEEALAAATGCTVHVHGSGRTDTGVHALGQVAHCHLETRLDDDRLWHAWNAHLPEGVVVRRLETCADGFHAQFDARSKRYMYVIATGRFRPALGRHLCHWVRVPLAVGPMREAARLLVGRHDFRAFGNSGSPRRSTVRRVQAVRILARRERLAIVVQADGFLYNMVRTIAGTLIDVGRGRRDPECVRRALETGRRDEAGPTAPPEGLRLLSVRYDERPFACGAGAGRRR